MLKFRTWRTPYIAAIVAMMAHVFMSMAPASAAMPPPGATLSLTEALAIVCTADGAKTDPLMAHSCGHCTLCPVVVAKTPHFFMVAVVFIPEPKTRWALNRDELPVTLADIVILPPGRAPPAATPIIL